MTILPTRLLGAILSCAIASTASAHSGSTVWGGWTFDWEVKDNAGLALRNVRYNAEEVLYKISMPVIRVKYAGDACGPYADRINWDNLVPISNCSDKKLCQKSYTSGGRNWLEIGVYARIGAYHIYQAYYLSHDGYIRARLWSKGLHCEIDHDHHPYWRGDFDIVSAGGDQIFVFDNNRPDQGWGPGWLKYTQENNDKKNPATQRVWFVRDSSSGHGMWVLPSGDDGTAGSFSTKDTGSRLYKSSEDLAWAFGASGHLGYDNGENIAEKDVILWYVSHLDHKASEGSSAWHSTGPWLKVDR